MDEDVPQDEEESHIFDWTDVLAFTIAAYQVLLPFVLALIGVLGLVYFLVWLVAR